MNKKIFIKLIILMFFVLFLLFPKKEISSVKSFSPKLIKNLYNIDAEKNTNGKTVYKVSDLTYQENKLPYITDIILSFNYPSELLHKDDTGKYNISLSDYNFFKGNGSLGKGGAEFYKERHGVEIETVKNLWLGSSGDLGSFTIEFRFRPGAERENNILFSRIGYLSGNKKGIEIVYNQGTVKAKFYKVFEDPKGHRYDVFLNKSKFIEKNKWYHFSLSFDRISGKLTKYINGEEEEVVYVTENGEPYNNVFMPSFGYRKRDGTLIRLDSPIAVIGKGFSGSIDEFKISYKHFADLEKRTKIAYRNYKDLGIIGRTPFNVEGIITSPIYSFEDTGTKVKFFSWGEDLKKNTFVWMEFRICDYLFLENDINIKWYRIKNGQRKIFLKKSNDDEYLRGKYYQWRAHLITSPNGDYSPAIYDINLNYQMDTAPDPPGFIEIANSGNKYVLLRWQKNVDFDIFGYRIYYGVKSDRCDGIISHVNGQRITNSISKGDYIELKITNDLIEENMLIDKRKLLNFPILKNTVLYFFSVSAYDSYKPDTSYNHESILSKQVSARPFAGSEID